MWKYQVFTIMSKKLNLIRGVSLLFISKRLENCKEVEYLPIRLFERSQNPPFILLHTITELQVLIRGILAILPTIAQFLVRNQAAAFAYTIIWNKKRKQSTNWVKTLILKMLVRHSLKCYSCLCICYWIFKTLAVYFRRDRSYVHAFWIFPRTRL